MVAEKDAAPEPASKVAFASFNLPKPIMKAIDAAGFEHCTDIQAQTLPHTLLGKDCIGKAQTGTGKTAAFLLSVLTDLLENPLPKQYNGEPRALVLAPTRELAQQIAADANQLTKFAKLNVVTVVGGMDFEKQKQQLIGNKVDLLVATPGRLIDFVQRRNVYLDQVEVLVIDEADRMLDMGFIPDLRQIVRATPRKEVRQTLMFSATFTEQVMRLARSWTQEPVTVEIEPTMKTSDRVEQHVYLTSNDDKFQILKNLLESEEIERAMVFANRRDLVRQLTEDLKRAGIDCAMLSGEVSQDKRVKVLNRFKSGQVKVMVATDVAGRGIHVDGVSHVVNYTLPEDAEDYVHRIGRTGRAGAKGLSVSFACEDDSFLIPDLEKYLGKKIELERPPEELLARKS
ncbi:ATP-dependent RNA helicase RhlB [Salinibius halmophilus]|uniref:ATP-dependent RNA helicase RhlB n=1 Tax=Salinibius halmophilus TaxID=1853216 RepID=UPI003899F4E2